ncbi:MAG: hypothetical protein AAB215_00430 [Planctomycetota bacterium]
MTGPASRARRGGVALACAFALAGCGTAPPGAGEAARWLLGRLGPDGAFLYRYDAKKDEESDRRNFVRQAGAAYSLIQFGRTAGAREALDGGRKALGFLLARLSRETRDGADVAFLSRNDGGKAPSDAQSPLGAAALAMLAILEIPAADRTAAEAAAVEPLSRFLRWMQHPDGRFWKSREERLAKADPGPPADYFPGEAMFALSRHAAETKSPESRRAALLAAARQFMEFRAGASPDHWTMQGLALLATGREDPGEPPENAPSLPRGQILDMLEAMSAEILGEQIGEEGREAFRGGFRSADPPRLAHAATRLEGLGAARSALAASGRDISALDRGIRAGLGFVRSLQVGPAEARTLPNPAKALGGFRGAPGEWDMRIDYAQHALSAFLLCERR